MLIKRLARLALLLLLLGLLAYGTTVRPLGQGSSAPAAINQSTDPLLGAFRLRSIGPASMGGRIDDIAVSESDRNITYIAYAVGGVYKTTDGGRTWATVRSIDEDTGCTDIPIDPSSSNILCAASYQRRRSGGWFSGGGPGSALWKATDAGRTWNKLTGNGLPPGTY